MDLQLSIAINALFDVLSYENGVMVILLFFFQGLHTDCIRILFA